LEQSAIYTICRITEPLDIECIFRFSDSHLSSFELPKFTQSSILFL